MTKFNLSIDDDNDDNDNFDEFVNFFENHTLDQKDSLISDMVSNADTYNSEVEERKKESDKKKKKYIKYIVKNSDEYNKKNLLNYELISIIEIYCNVKEQKQNKIKNILNFFR